MKTGLILILVGCILHSTAQYYIPTSFTNSTTDIANYITSREKQPRAVVHAIYSWVTANIRYDSDSANRINLHPNPDLKITAALRRRKGVCENYAAIFNDIAVRSGLKSFLVAGYTRQGGRIDRVGHAWSAVQIGPDWFLCDPTWDEGSSAFRFFLVDPQDFIETHMPFDPLWQLLEYPVSHEAFSNGSLYAKSRQRLNYKDSVTAFLALGELEQLQASSVRIRHFGMYNPLVKNNFAVTRMNIEMLHEDKDMDLYNSAITGLNKATVAINDFIQYRNNRFLPSKNDEALKKMLEGIDLILLNAANKLHIIDKSHASLKLTTDAAAEKLNNLSGRLTEQQQFLDRYIKSGLAEREQLFYK